MPLSAWQDACNALIRRSIDLRQSYRYAATASEPGVRMVLNEHAQTLDGLIADLQVQVGDSGGKPCIRGSWRGSGRRQLAGWLAHVVARRDDSWIRILAHDESVLLHAFERTIGSFPAESSCVLAGQLPRLRDIHMDMHSLVASAR